MIANFMPGWFYSGISLPIMGMAKKLHKYFRFKRFSPTVYRVFFSNSSCKLARTVKEPQQIAGAFFRNYIVIKYLPVCSHRTCHCIYHGHSKLLCLHFPDSTNLRNRRLTSGRIRKLNVNHLTILTCLNHKCMESTCIHNHRKKLLSDSATISSVT